MQEFERKNAVGVGEKIKVVLAFFVGVVLPLS
jgi:hypothetical protein